VSYLNNKRTNQSDSLSPFTDDSIEKIFFHSQGNTRRIISLCSQALDASLDFNKSQIDLEILDSVITG
jgi:hypothetical protein